MIAFATFDMGSGLPYSDRMLSADTMSSFPSLYELLPSTTTLWHPGRTFWGFVRFWLAIQFIPACFPSAIHFSKYSFFKSVSTGAKPTERFSTAAHLCISKR